MPDGVGDRAPRRLGGVLAVNIDAHAHFSEAADASHSLNPSSDF
jgi:hypothetical protein